MEKHNMLALSTGHLTQKTICNMENFIAYEKGEYGWFVYVPEIMDTYEMPKDLDNCIQFARNNGCDWIMFDRDVETIDSLQIYDWD